MPVTAGEQLRLRARGVAVASSMAGPPWSRPQLLEIGEDLFADDVDINDDAFERLHLLPRPMVEEFFLSGGVLPPPPPPPFKPPSCSINSNKLASALQAAGQVGLLELADLPAVPFAQLQSVFDNLHAGGTSSCYPPNLKVKDANAKKANESADQKRILDLNPKRLREAEDLLASIDSSSDEAAAFRAVVAFWRSCLDDVIPALTRAVAKAAGSDAILEDDHYDFRMLDYYEREWSSPSEQDVSSSSSSNGGGGGGNGGDGRKAAPRCRAHRDFGSVTLVFAQSAGLQAQIRGGDNDAMSSASGDGDPSIPWRDVAVLPGGSALLLFGWCTQIRSNGRLHACQHRVADAPPDPLTGRSSRRSSFVLFVSPREISTRPLDPVVLKGEKLNYKAGVSAEAQLMYNQRASNAFAKPPPPLPPQPPAAAPPKLLSSSSFDATRLLRWLMAFCCWGLAKAMPIRNGGNLPGTCTAVDLVHTNLAHDEALSLMSLYLSVAEVSGTEPEPIAKSLMAKRGGFWDVYFMGTAFSYSVTCSEYVELANDKWNVLLCKEAEDSEAMRCGRGGLMRYANGTLTSSSSSSDLGGRFELDRYENFMTNEESEKAAAREERVPVVRAALEAMRDDGTLHSPGAADKLRARLPWKEKR